MSKPVIYSDKFAATLRHINVSLQDLEALRLILKGDSVIDWHKLEFSTIDDVNQFLNANQYFVENREDTERLRTIFSAAIKYLNTNFHYHFPKEIREITDVRELFLTASSTGYYQELACMILKVMHIINHIEARELRFFLPISEETLFRLAEEKVNKCVVEMKQKGFPIIEYQGSRKTRDSLITKLLAKRSTLAAQIFDKLRFRLVVKDSNDLIPVLIYMKQNLFPFNYIIPLESKNNIINLRSLLDESSYFKNIAGDLEYGIKFEEMLCEHYETNPYTSEHYRMINFIVDMPIRVDQLICLYGQPMLQHMGNIVFLLIEFQMFDETSYGINEEGSNSHERYKARQKWDVISRLVHGMVPFNVKTANIKNFAPAVVEKEEK
ncbi:MAG: TIGR04552 family protein [Deltaproteobacteria bacterium]|nr:TIGR04552 family protein [Deltaproteobacteria bacterium]